jgi:hypothetical protein
MYTQKLSTTGPPIRSTISIDVDCINLHLQLASAYGSRLKPTRIHASKPITRVIHLAVG